MDEKQIKTLRKLCELINEMDETGKAYLLGWLEGAAGKEPEMSELLKKE